MVRFASLMGWGGGEAPAPSAVMETASSKWSLWSEDSFLSIASKGSVLSIASIGSFLSLGSIASAASAFSISSAASLGSIMSFRTRGGVLSTGVSRAAAVDHGQQLGRIPAALRPGPRPSARR